MLLRVSQGPQGEGSKKKQDWIIKLMKYIDNHIHNKNGLANISNLNKGKAKVNLTSEDLSLALNLATRSCVVTGVFCIKTALISSSLTGPEAAVEDPVFDDAGGGGVPFEGALLLVVDPFTSLADDFVS